jgi:hypothetical protein
MEKFESTIVIGGAGAEPARAAKLVERVVQWARDKGTSQIAFRSVTLTRSTVVLAGELNGDATKEYLRSELAILGAELKLIASGKITSNLPKSAEDA